MEEAFANFCSKVDFPVPRSPMRVTFTFIFAGCFFVSSWTASSMFALCCCKTSNFSSNIVNYWGTFWLIGSVRAFSACNCSNMKFLVTMNGGYPCSMKYKIAPTLHMSTLES